MNRRSGDEEDVRVRTVPRSHLQQSRDHPDADFLLISCISCLFLGASNCLTTSLSGMDTVTRYLPTPISQVGGSSGPVSKYPLGFGSWQLGVGNCRATEDGSNAEGLLDFRYVFWPVIVPDRAARHADGRTASHHRWRGTRFLGRSGAQR